MHNSIHILMCYLAFSMRLCATINGNDCCLSISCNDDDVDSDASNLKHLFVGASNETRVNVCLCIQSNNNDDDLLKKVLLPEDDNIGEYCIIG